MAVSILVVVAKASAVWRRIIVTGTNARDLTIRMAGGDFVRAETTKAVLVRASVAIV
jgi:hypothetical protein